MRRRTLSVIGYHDLETLLIYNTDFLANEARERTDIVGAFTLESLVEKLKRPRRILMMIQGIKLY